MALRCCLSPRAAACGSTRERTAAQIGGPQPANTFLFQLFKHLFLAPRGARETARLLKLSRRGTTAVSPPRQSSPSLPAASRQPEPNLRGTSSVFRSHKSRRRSRRSPYDTCPSLKLSSGIKGSADGPRSRISASEMDGRSVESTPEPLVSPQLHRSYGVLVICWPFSVNSRWID